MYSDFITRRGSPRLVLSIYEIIKNIVFRLTNCGYNWNDDGLFTVRFNLITKRVNKIKLVYIGKMKGCWALHCESNIFKIKFIVKSFGD